MSRTDSRLIAFSQVRRDDRRIALDDARRPAGDDAAGAQHGDVVGDLHDQPDVMLDQQDGDPLVPDPSDQAAQLVNLGRIHAGGGFVEKQKPRFAGERAGDLETALIAEASAPAAASCRLAGNADEVEHLPRLVGGRQLAGGQAKQRRRIAEDPRSIRV